MEKKNIDNLRVEAREELRAAIESAGGPKLALIFDLWHSIEILCLVAPYGGVTEYGQFALTDLTDKLSLLLKGLTETENETP